MTVVKWVFFDPILVTSYTFEINPNAGGSPQYKKNFTYQSTAAPAGATLVFQGRSDPLTLEFSGVTLSQTHYETMVTWWQKQCVIQLTDDLGRVFQVIFSDFNPTRKRALHYPWMHNYTAKCTVVSTTAK